MFSKIWHSKIIIYQSKTVIFAPWQLLHLLRWQCIHLSNLLTLLSKVERLLHHRNRILFQPAPDHIIKIAIMKVINKRIWRATFCSKCHVEHIVIQYISSTSLIRKDHTFSFVWFNGCLPTIRPTLNNPICRIFFVRAMLCSLVEFDTERIINFLKLDMTCSKISEMQEPYWSELSVVSGWTNWMNYTSLLHKKTQI